MYLFHKRFRQAVLIGAGFTFWTNSIYAIDPVRSARTKPAQTTGKVAIPPAKTTFAMDRVEPIPPQAIIKPVAQKQATPLTPAVIPAAADATPKITKPLYGLIREELPIDLTTVFRLVNQQNPSLGVARARLGEALAKQQKAELLFIPNFAVGSNFTRFDGQTQNQRGEVFGVSRGNLFLGGGPQLSVDIADAIYEPLIARRITQAEGLNVQATTQQLELEAVSAYLELAQVYAAIAINADTLAPAEQMLKYAQDAKDAELSKTAGDVNRAKTEVFLRQQERLDLQARAGVASARLVRVLLLEPTVVLRPMDSILQPVVLVDGSKTLDDLIGIAYATRPDLAAFRSVASAAWERVRKARHTPFIPKAIVQEQIGTFGGGRNSDLQNYSARNALNVQLLWELKNLGFGNRADIREKEAAWEQTTYRVADIQAQIAAEVMQAAQVAERPNTIAWN